MTKLFGERHLTNKENGCGDKCATAVCSQVIGTDLLRSAPGAAVQPRAKPYAFSYSPQRVGGSCRRILRRMSRPPVVGGGIEP